MPLSVLALDKDCCSCVNKSSSRTKSWAIVSVGCRRSWCQLSNLLKESGTGSSWRGDRRRTSRSFRRPPMDSYSSGFRCFTTAFAGPWSLAQTRLAACFRSFSLRLVSYHLQAMQKASNSEGSPDHTGTDESLEDVMARPRKELRYHEGSRVNKGNLSKDRRQVTKEHETPKLLLALWSRPAESLKLKSPCVLDIWGTWHVQNPHWWFPLVFLCFLAFCFYLLVQIRCLFIGLRISYWRKEGFVALWLLMPSRLKLASQPIILVVMVFLTSRCHCGYGGRVSLESMVSVARLVPRCQVDSIQKFPVWSSARGAIETTDLSLLCTGSQAQSSKLIAHIKSMRNFPFQA